MAHGDPLRAKEIYKKLDKKWFDYWHVWKSERIKAGVPDSIVGMFGEKK